MRIRTIFNIIGHVMDGKKENLHYDFDASNSNWMY